MCIRDRIYTFITAAACCAAISGIMPFSSSAEESVKTYGDLSYVSSDSDGDRIYDYIAIIDCNESVTKIEIPAEIEDIPVVEIESSAFNGCANLTSIIIPDSITSIGDFAFENCSGLTRDVYKRQSLNRLPLLLLLFLYYTLYIGCAFQREIPEASFLIEKSYCLLKMNGISIKS